MEAIDWTTLPDQIWVQILDNLDVKSLLNATEVCKTFADVFDSSSKLNRKVCFVLEKNYVTNESTLEALQESKRKYKSVKSLRYSRDVSSEGEIALIGILSSLFQDVEEITFSRGVFYCGLFDESTKLQKLRIYEHYHESIVQKGWLQQLLANKKNLKTLHINGYQFYENTETFSALDSFQLEDLKLNYVYLSTIAPVFFKQQSLKTVDLHLNWDGNIRDIESLVKSKNLHTVKIGGYAGSLVDSFCQDFKCSSVKNFTFNIDQNFNPGLNVLLMLSAAFPNVKNFTLSYDKFTDHIKLSLVPWRHLESLTVVAEHKCLKELTVQSGNFKSFEFGTTKLSDDFPKNFGDFLARHQSIRQIKIRRYYFYDGSKSYEDYSQEIEQVIAAELPQLENFEVLPIAHDDD